MNKKFSKIFALVLVLVMTMAMAVPAMAADTATGKGVTQVTLDKNLIMKSNAKVPATSFEFTLSAFNGEDKFPLFNGILTGVKVNGNAVAADGKFTVTFEGTESTVKGLPSDEEVPTGDSATKYATKNFTIDFSGVTFTEPGVYRYKLTETAPESPFGYYSPEAGTRYIDVYVEYATDGATVPTIQGIVVHKNDSAVTTGTDNGTNTETLGDKDGDFNNEYKTYDLTLEKFVSGNQASRTQHFEFEVTVTNPAAAEGATTTYPAYEVVTNGCTDNTSYANPTSITAGAATKFELKNGESLVIKGLPVGATYTITEKTTGYTVTYTVTEKGSGAEGADSTLASKASGSEYANTAGIKGDTTVTFTNTREGVVPTGILLTIAPFAALIVIGFAGVLFINLKKKRRVQ